MDWQSEYKYKYIQLEEKKGEYKYKYIRVDKIGQIPIHIQIFGLVLANTNTNTYIFHTLAYRKENVQTNPPFIVSLHFIFPPCKQGPVATA